MVNRFGPNTQMSEADGSLNFRPAWSTGFKTSHLKAVNVENRELVKM